MLVVGLVTVLPYKSRDAELDLDSRGFTASFNTVHSHHGWPQDIVGSDPLYFQPAAEAPNGLHLVVRAARVPN